ncbi:hypothetical protein CDAR_114241, partial [Caerostris darwini]
MPSDALFETITVLQLNGFKQE